MGSEHARCRLYEPDGTLLSAGHVETWDPDAACRVLVAGLDWPGQVVQRCLVGDVREVRLELAGGPSLPAHVEQVRFDPTRGRSCALHLVSVCRQPSADGHPRADQAPASPRHGP